MSQENVEIVRLMNAAFNCGDLYEAFGFYHPAAIWRSRRDEPDIANRPLKTKEPRCQRGLSHAPRGTRTPGVGPWRPVAPDSRLSAR